jgi:hypothetical protein
LKWKENLAVKASEIFLKRQRETPNLRKLIYGNGKYSLFLLGCNHQQYPHANFHFETTVAWVIVPNT